MGKTVVTKKTHRRARSVLSMRFLFTLPAFIAMQPQGTKSPNSKVTAKTPAKCLNYSLRDSINRSRGIPFVISAVTFSGFHSSTEGARGCALTIPISTAWKEKCLMRKWAAINNPDSCLIPKETTAETQLRKK
ncbi:hypothetical protein NDU88_002724 [Pleurodeles waltl]|uniref:Uncharacterized protein n=1 Tax=Pleurodeles waltl TaxID=8319 RepID=A0AAV7KW90_PLEWA|nr:hypothetical protein NDU88_002724 [Pleurodeles waltl]